MQGSLRICAQAVRQHPPSLRRSAGPTRGDVLRSLVGKQQTDFELHTAWVAPDQHHISGFDCDVGSAADHKIATIFPLS